MSWFAQWVSLLRFCCLSVIGTIFVCWRGELIRKVLVLCWGTSNVSGLSVLDVLKQTHLEPSKVAPFSFVCCDPSQHCLIWISLQAILRGLLIRFRELLVQVVQVPCSGAIILYGLVVVVPIYGILLLCWHMDFQIVLLTGMISILQWLIISLPCTIGSVQVFNLCIGIEEVLWRILGEFVALVTLKEVCGIYIYIYIYISVSSGSHSGLGRAIHAVWELFNEHYKYR